MKILLNLSFLFLAIIIADQSNAIEFKEVPRKDTVIFENIEGRVPIPNNMNPYIAGQYLDWGMWQATQESLFYYNYETGEMMPWLAKSFEFNSDFTQVTIKLREGVKWSDGKPFSAKDVVFTINMLKKNPYALALNRRFGANRGTSGYSSGSGSDSE